MSVFGNAVRFLDDHINPVLVKELRQAVQSNFVTVLLLVYLLIDILAMMLAVLFDHSLTSSLHAGGDVFMTLDTILLGTCLLFVPTYAGIRLAAERADQNVDLMFITTIQPGAVIWGKALTALAIALLVVSVCAPFMMMTFLLRGIDVPTICFVVAMDLVVVGAGVAGALFIAALPIRWPIRLLLALALLVGMVTAFSLAISGAGGLILWGVGSRMASWHFWIPTLMFLGFILAACGLLLFLACAALAPQASDRARPVRLYATLAWALTGAACVVVARAHWPLGDPSDFGRSFLRAWANGAIGLLAIGLVIAGCERDVWGLRLRRTVPRAPALRPFWLVFSSGALGGLLWTGLMIAGTLATLWFGMHPHRKLMPHLVREIHIDVGLVCTVLSYVLVGTLLRDYVFRRKVNTMLVGALAMLLMAAGSLIPMLIAAFHNPDSWGLTDTRWLFLNPMAGIALETHRHGGAAVYSMVAVIWCGIMVLLNLPWAVRQLRACRPAAENVPLESRHQI
jgi:hypothetical protein